MKKIIIIPFLVILFCSFTPPGTIKIPDTIIYIDKSEISNDDWLGYIIYLKDWRQADSVDIQPMLPDPRVWSSVYHGSFTSIASIMQTAPKSLDHPVVGVSYAQVVEYCKWRSEVVRIKYGKKVIYRLPTPEEWLKYANQIASKDNNQTMPDSLQAVSTAKASKNDVFHFADNISEMTSEKGIAMGNNYTDKERGFDKHTYTNPEKWLGFRCVCEVSSE